MLDARSESASGRSARGYVPIGDYAAIGDGRTVALVARDGSIDWLCLPDLDSPSVFAAVLDADRGGRFALRARDPRASASDAICPTPTCWRPRSPPRRAWCKVTDAMALPSSDLGPTRELIRRVDCLAGRVPMRWRITPAFGYGAVPPRIGRRGRIPVAVGGRDALAVCSWEAGEAQIDDGAIFGRFEARESSSALIALCAAHQEPLVFPTREQVEATSGRHGRLLAALGRAACVRRPVARCRDPQRAGAQAALLRALRGDRGGGDRVAARGDRRRAQLGLPLLLGARLGIHARGPPAPRVPERGRGVLLVAAARVPAHAPAPAGPLPPGRRRARTRAHARAGRLPGIAPGPGRQRRRRADPAGHLRRPAPDRPDLRGGRRPARPRDRPPTRRHRRPRLPHLARSPTPASGRCEASPCTSPTPR